jgi:hypothetical protein
MRRREIRRKSTGILRKKKPQRVGHLGRSSDLTVCHPKDVPSRTKYRETSRSSWHRPPAQRAMLVSQRAVTSIPAASVRILVAPVAKNARHVAITSIATTGIAQSAEKKDRFAPNKRATVRSTSASQPRKTVMMDAMHAFLRHCATSVLLPARNLRPAWIERIGTAKPATTLRN